MKVRMNAMRRKINLNGSSKADLIAEYQKVSELLDGAIKNFCIVTPHGRDYQANSNPDQDYEMDRMEHLEMLRKMQHIKKYVTECMLQIYRQE